MNQWTRHTVINPWYSLFIHYHNKLSDRLENKCSICWFTITCSQFVFGRLIHENTQIVNGGLQYCVITCLVCYCMDSYMNRWPRHSAFKPTYTFFIHDHNKLSVGLEQVEKTYRICWFTINYPQFVIRRLIHENTQIVNEGFPSCVIAFLVCYGKIPTWVDGRMGATHCLQPFFHPLRSMKNMDDREVGGRGQITYRAEVDIFWP